MGKGLTVTGEVVEVPDDMFNIVREIGDRWPNLWVVYANPDSKTSSGKLGPCLGDAPFQVWERTKTGPQHVMDVWKLDQSVIAHLSMINGANVDVQAEMEKHNAKLRREHERQQEEDLAQGADEAATVLRHFGKGKLEFKYTNTHGEKRVIRDGQNGPRKIKVL